MLEKCRARNGGGVNVETSRQVNATLCVFKGNRAGAGGGLHTFTVFRAHINLCSFTANNATSNGGGIALKGTEEVQLQGVRVSDNQCGSGGCGLYISTTSSLRCTIGPDAEFTRNFGMQSLTYTARAYGGGAYITTQSAEARVDVFSDAGDYPGPGLNTSLLDPQNDVNNFASYLHVDGATFAENSAPVGGGLYLDMKASWRVVLTDSRFERNWAEVGGGLRVDLNDASYSSGFEKQNKDY